MRTNKYRIYISVDERIEIIKSLVGLRNKLILQGRYTDAVDDILCKFTTAKMKTVKVKFI